VITDVPSGQLSQAGAPCTPDLVGNAWSAYRLSIIG
jgi:hypothetical protein